MIQVVFVCTGNICRSPMAEGIFRERWNLKMGEPCKSTSMGVHGLDNQPASQYAQKVCLEHGVDISSHRSRQLVYDEMQSAHIVFALERVHKEFIATFFPRFNEKVFLLGAWPDAETKKSNVDDPMGGTLKAYEKCYSIIAHHVDRIIPFLPDIYP